MARGSRRDGQAIGCAHLARRQQFQAMIENKHGAKLAPGERERNGRRRIGATATNNASRVGAEIGAFQAGISCYMRARPA